ncbi:MAG TPA: hypothetical protein VI248_12450 [Kineosporiaceae bacterium]
MDEGIARIFEAHVRYEVDRWREDAVGAAVTHEVDACFDWLGEVTLSDLLPVDIVRDGVQRLVVDDQTLSDGLVEEISWAVRAAQESLLQETDPLQDVLPRATYEHLVTGVVGLRRLREEIVAQITGSTVYSQLIGHVLYHGVKEYLLTENVVVRRLPGASSLVRLSQNAVRAATPNLEAGLDRRLVAFVAANVSQTVRDSRQYLTATLDDAMLRTIAEEIWATNGPRPVGEVADLVESPALGGLGDGIREVWFATRSSDIVARLIDAVLDQFYQAHGDQPVADILDDLGMTRENVGAGLGRAATALIAAARDRGYLEASVRSRLEGFYSAYSATSSETGDDQSAR